MKSNIFSPYFIRKENLDVLVRDIKKEDAKDIVELFRANYGNTYYKKKFYDPNFWANLPKNLYPVVAEIDNKVVGQFLLTKYDNYIGEVSAVVVHPNYKGRGIMNKMFKYILQKAKNLGLSAVYGEAIMFHPFSQKANLTHGMVESALQLGEVASWIAQKDIKFEKRSATIVGFKIFNHNRHFVNIPKIYERAIKEVYKKAKIKHFKRKRRIKPKISYEINSLLKISTIIIDSKPKNFKNKFQKIFALLKQKSDMIYADINLESPNTNELVEFLNKEGFFYCGVLFYKHNGADYLRLQFENTHNIEEKLNVCYSKYCKKLTRFVYEDKKRIRSKK